jgi:hypothetical protein
LPAQSGHSQNISEQGPAGVLRLHELLDPSARFRQALKLPQPFDPSDPAVNTEDAALNHRRGGEPPAPHKDLLALYGEMSGGGD